MNLKQKQGNVMLSVTLIGVYRKTGIHRKTGKQENRNSQENTYEYCLNACNQNQSFEGLL